MKISEHEELMAAAIDKWTSQGGEQPCSTRSTIIESMQGDIRVVLANVNGVLVEYDFDLTTGELVETNDSYREVVG